MADLNTYQILSVQIKGLALKTLWPASRSLGTLL